jgi:hypothetical protein
VVLTIIIGLKKDHSSGNKGGIDGYSELTGGIWVLKNWLTEEAIFQGQE